MSLLADLKRSGALRTLDSALAETLRRLEPATPEPVLAAAALASLAVAQGHAGFALAQPNVLVDAALAWPDADVWAQQLAASPLVATPSSAQAQASTAPLVLEHGLLYLRRYREYECRLALRLCAIAAHAMQDGGDGTADTDAALFAALFPPAHVDPHQARAAALALHRALLLITGGPGTGKTTTIAKLLVLRLANALQAGGPPLRIALAAPTGRAADRMAESLRRAVAQMQAQGIDAAWLAALPTTASTVHRLLGVIRDKPDFRHHAENPLPYDIVVVDEASMVDLPLMCKLTEAVADGAQLILLGDPDQLPSVEAGDVLAAILHAAGTDAMGDHAAVDSAKASAPTPSLARAARRGGLGRGAATNAPLHGHRVHLARGWRQSDTLHLAPLADAVRRGDAREALQLLRSGSLSNVYFHETAEDPFAAAGLNLLAHFRSLASAANPAAALARINQLRLLTALRDGPQGARGLNARIEAQLSGRRLGSPPAWFAGRLLLISENSYQHGLFNGDVGICLADDTGAPTVWFPGGSDGVRGFHPASLPVHESAFAMTVHKAQGSEFDTVWLQLPRTDARVLSRELVYTGLTRARSALHLAGSEAVLTAALARHASRVSGLAWRLGAQPRSTSTSISTSTSSGSA
jgi:exodeoxyribonuclease V alpha subunit